MMLLDHNGRPLQASFGRHVRRSAASLQGTMSNWANQVVGVRLAEREKRRVSERAEDLYTNSAIGHGLIEGAVVETVGIGLTPQPSPMLDFLGIDDDEWAEAYETRIEDLFEIWGFDPRHYCCKQKRMNAYQQQAWAYFSWKLHGIGLMQVVFDKSPNRPFRFCLLPIDASRLATPPSKQSAEIYDGVEVDTNGAVVAVHIAKPTPAGRYSVNANDFIRLPVWHEETGLPQILITVDVRNPAEYKQDSMLAAVMKEIKDSDDFVDAALVRSVAQTLFAIYVSVVDPSSGGLVNTSGTPDADGNVDWSTRTYELPKGFVVQGPPGSKPEMLTSKAAPDGYRDLWESTVERVGMATQRGSENILKKYDASFAASMANIISAEKFEDYDRMVLVGQHCQPALAWLLYECMLAGRLKVKNARAFRENLHAFTRADWLAPPQRRINSQNEAAAEDKKLANHTMSYSDSFARRGKSWKKGLTQKAKEKKFLKRLEVKYEVDMQPPTPAGSAPGKSSDNDGNDIKDDSDES